MEPNTQDIKVIMALGDSLSAGFGMEYHGLGGPALRETRGRSFSTGGVSGIATIPNFLISTGSGPIIKGATYKNTIPALTLMPEGMRQVMRSLDLNQLNPAVSGAKLDEIDEQITYLEKNIGKIEPAVQWWEWKLVNFFIGANDYLLRLKLSFPNTIVNVILLPDVSQIATIGKGSGCYNFRNFLGACPCAKTEEGRLAMQEAQLQYNQIMINAANRVNQGSTNFAAVVQPGLVNTIIEREFVSDLDCFHLNELGHQLVTIALWNR
eukprot:gene11481-13386_t